MLKTKVIKLKIVADLHTHTLASTHAYSTVLENAKYASEIGLKYLAITDHAPTLTDAPHIWHFVNLRMLPNEIFGVKILKGAEVNILNKDGEIDLPVDVLKGLDWVVASFHHPACAPMPVDDCTNAYMNIAKNPYVDLIGHSGLQDFAYDYEKTIKVFKEYDKLVEINQNSFIARKSSLKNCAEIAKICKKNDVKIAVTSDAHFAYGIAMVDDAMKLLKEIDYPENLIINSSIELFEDYLKNRKR